jgi:hypothetical protein
MRRRTAVLAVVSAAALMAAVQPVAANAAGVTTGSVQQVPVSMGKVKNVDVGRHGQLVWADFAGPKVRVVEYPLGGRARTVAELPAGMASAAQDPAGHTWVVYGEPEGGPPQQKPSLWRVDRNGRARLVLDIAAYQQKDPDPFDTEGKPAESNPYDVDALDDGSALVADAANNDVLHVLPDGRTTTLACFPKQRESTRDMPPDQPRPGPFMDAEAVPTGVAAGRDHRHAYVSELKGLPFARGSSQVWRIDLNRVRQGCRAGQSPGRLVAWGFSALNDVALDGRALLVTQLHRDGTWAAEAAARRGSAAPGTGRLLRVSGGPAHELARGALTYPGSAVVGPDGHIYVTNNWLFQASLLRITR